MTLHIAEEASARIEGKAFTVLERVTPPKDPDEEDEDDEG